MNIEITLLCTIIGALVGALSYKMNSDKKIETDASQKTEVATKLDYISKGVDDIRLDIKVQDNSIKDLTMRMIKCEESTKSAHHRIDEFKGEVTYEK